MGKPIIDFYTKEQLEEIVNSSNSMAEVATRLGYMSQTGRNNDTIRKRLEKYGISTEHFAYRTPVKRTPENVFCEYSTASQNTLKRWYCKQENIENRCSICGQNPIWNGKPLPLILDHINRDKHDNRIENLRLVCPNCNQQLETTKYRTKYNKDRTIYRCAICGKEISKEALLCVDCYAMERRKVERPSREILKDKIRNMQFKKIGQEYNVTESTIRKWCKSYNLPFRKRIIEKYTNNEWIDV